MSDMSDFEQWCVDTYGKPSGSLCLLNGEDLAKAYQAAKQSMQVEHVGTIGHDFETGNPHVNWRIDTTQIAGAKLYTHAPDSAARIAELEAENEALRKGKYQALYLPWNYVSESIPPGAENHWFSPKVWLALSDGRVMPGQCLHKVKNAIYEDPVHAWFIFEENGGPGLMLSHGIDVVAWMPFAKPDHPGIALPTIKGVRSERNPLR